MEYAPDYHEGYAKMKEHLEAELADITPVKYEPLPSPTCIRLLRRCDMSRETQRKVQSARGAYAYEMRVFELEDAPAYEALSYTWGHHLPANVRPIEWGEGYPRLMFIDGCGLLIGDSLSHSLKLTGLHVINGWDDPYTQINQFHKIARHGSVRDVRKYIAAGADVTFADRMGRTALHHAAAEGNLEVVKELTQPEYMHKYLRNMKIEVSGKSESKMKETAAYLKELQGGDVPESEGWWWADAVCINQKDLEERASQVRLMAKIYSTARHVHISLGCWRRHSYPERPENGWRNKKQTPSTIQEALQFFRRTWFTRTWIVQELVLARDVTFHFDEQQISYELFEKALEYIEREKQPLRSTVEAVDEARRAIRQGECLRRLRNYFQQRHRRAFTLYSLLVNCATFNSLEPRDKIFGLLNLVRNHDGEHESPIEIDYTKPLYETYTNATRQAMMDEESLSPLCWASTWFEGHRDLDGQPSWVPAYHLFGEVRGPDTALDGFDQLSHLSDAPRPRCFSASGRLRRSRNDQAFEGPTSIHSGDLEVNGVHFDRIQAICKGTERQIRFKASWLDLVGPLSTGPYINGDSIAKALMLTAFAGKYNVNSVFNRNTPEAVWSEAKDIWHDLICNSVAIGKGELPEHAAEVDGRRVLTENKVRLLDDIAKADGEGFAIDSDYLAGFVRTTSSQDTEDGTFRGKLNDAANHTLGETLVNALYKRCLYRTEKGHLGLAPKGAQRGDEVWILPALNVPVILRNIKAGEGEKDDDDGDQNRYKHIGETYVHGIMFGEAVPDAKVKLQSIVVI